VRGRYRGVRAVAEEARRVFGRHTTRHAASSDQSRQPPPSTGLEPARHYGERQRCSRAGLPLESFDHNRANVLIHMGRRHEALFVRARDAFRPQTKR
jgi:hypothetical protein